MYNLIWSRDELNRQKLGAFCEYYAKMALSSYGMNIYSSEVDDHGIDFVAEMANRFLKFQVKSARKTTKYVFMRKEYFDAEADNLYLILILLADGEHPRMYMIPASTWKNADGKLFVSRDYEGKKSKPEYGIKLSAKNIPLLEKYSFEKMMDNPDWGYNTTDNLTSKEI